jgi:molybdopterin-guanine dinucleotide biosynthesis protein A
MGTDKALLRLPDGRTCLQTILDVAGAVTTEIILAIDTPLHAETVLRDYPGPRPALLLDTQPGQGPLAVLAHALQVTRAPALLALAVDMPLVAAPLLRALYAALLGDAGRSYDAAAPLIDGIPQPLCACYASKLSDLAATLVRSGRRDLRALLAAPGVTVRWLAAEELRHVDPSLRSFVSANTPEEWERLLDQAAPNPDSGSHAGAAG